MENPEIFIAITDQSMKVTTSTKRESSMGIKWANYEVFDIEQPCWAWEVFALIRGFYQQRWPSADGV